MGKKQKNSSGGFLDLIFGTNTGHSNNKRKSTWDKHSGANRNQGSGKPNSKGSVRERRRRNGG